MERRKTPKRGGTNALTKAVPLPVDYLKMVNEVFSTHFSEVLAELKKIGKKNHFTASGSIYPDEILLSVSLIEDGLLSATTAHASCDFDPTASQPTAEDLMAACVDALASLFSEILPSEDLSKLAEIVDQPLSAFESIPFVWTPMVVNKREIYLVVDKTNPNLEKMTEEWLEKNDPDRALEEFEEEEEEEDFLSERLGSKSTRGKPDPTRH